MLKALKKYKAPYLFILPFFILFFVFQLVPTIWTFYISFTDWKGIGDPEFSGLGNYKKMMVVLGVTWKYSCLLADRPRLYFILCTVDCMSVKQPFFKEQQRKSIFQNSYIPAKYLCSHRYGTYFPYAV